MARFGAGRSAGRVTDPALHGFFGNQVVVDRSAEDRRHVGQDHAAVRVGQLERPHQPLNGRRLDLPQLKVTDHRARAPGAGISVASYVVRSKVLPASHWAA